MCDVYLKQSFCHIVSYYHFIFFFDDTATTEIYTLSLHDALPIFEEVAHLFERKRGRRAAGRARRVEHREERARARQRSEEHTSELQSRLHLVCRLLLEKKKETTKHMNLSHRLKTDKTLRLPHTSN